MRKVAIILTLFLFSITACSARKEIIKSNRKLEKAVHKRDGSNFEKVTPEGYIQRFKAIAIQEMNLVGIPASITLAQGLLESAFGNSDLAQIAKNHFGIKCTSDWKGKGYYKDDDLRDDCFRVYSNPEESFKDHSEFLKRQRYAALFELDKNDFKGWAYGLKAAGYATNPKYPELLLDLINRYDLHQYDKKETDKTEKIKREDRVLSDINKNIPKEKLKDKPVDAAPLIKGNTYIVQKGDTAYNVSKRFGLTIDELLLLNNLKEATIKIGQALIIKK